MAGRHSGGVVRRRVAHGWAVGGVVAMSLTLVGCGGDASTSASATTASPESAESTLGTLRSTFEDQETSVLTFETTGQQQSITGQAEIHRGPGPESRITFGPKGDPALSLTFVLSEGGTYVTRSDVGPTLETPWARVDLEDGSDLSKALVEQVLSVLETTDFAGELELGSASTITDEGSAPIDGVSTTRYGVVTDVSEAIAATDGFTRRGLKVLDAAGVDTLQATWWIAEDGLPVKFERQTNTGSVTVTFESWGRELDISPPPADEIGDLESLFGDLDSAP